jgi:hypothetical protein
VLPDGGEIPRFSTLNPLLLFVRPVCTRPAATPLEAIVREVGLEGAADIVEMTAEVLVAEGSAGAAAFSSA